MFLKTKLYVCVGLNFVALSLLLLKQFYNEISEEFYYLGELINSYERYTLVLLFITIFTPVTVLADTVGTSILRFTVYNPYKSNISEFGKYELLLLTFLVNVTTGLRYAGFVIAMSSRWDIAMYELFVREVTSLLLAKQLLDEKTFIKTELDEVITHRQEMKKTR